MRNANNFISSVQISGIITGYSFRKSLETEKKNILESFLHQEKKATYRVSQKNAPFCILNPKLDQKAWKCYPGSKIEFQWGSFALGQLLLPEMTSKISKTALFNFIKNTLLICDIYSLKLFCLKNQSTRSGLHSHSGTPTFYIL